MRSFSAICVVFLLPCSNAGLQRAEYILSLGESQSHLPSKPCAVCCPSSSHVRLRTDFHQEITPGNTCCFLASTADLQVEAKSVQGPGKEKHYQPGGSVVQKMDSLPGMQ